MTRTYDDLKTHVYQLAKIYRQQANADEMFFGPHDEFTKRSRAAEAALAHLIKATGLEDDFKDWDNKN